MDDKNGCVMDYIIQYVIYIYLYFIYKHNVVYFESGK